MIAKAQNVGLGIFTSPFDLMFEIRQPNGADACFMRIARHVGGEWTPLLVSEVPLPRRAALDSVKRVIDLSMNIGSKKLQAIRFEQNECMTEKLRDKILDKLIETGEAITFSP